MLALSFIVVLADLDPHPYIYSQFTLLSSIQLKNLVKISQHLAETFMLELISLHDILVRASKGFSLVLSYIKLLNRIE